MTTRLPRGFKERYGANVNKMPIILRDKKASPMDVAEFMKARLIYGDKFPALLDNYSDSSDLIAYSDPRVKQVKFIYTCDNQGRVTEDGKIALKLINPKEERENGAVLLGDRYDALKGIVVPADKLGILGKGLTREQILTSKVWRMLSRNPNEVPAEIAEDEALLPEYVDYIASKREAREWNAFPMMDVHMDTLDKAKLRAFCVDGLQNGSYVNGGYDLDNDNGRLVGLAPEARAKLASWKPSQKNAKVSPCTLADWTEAEKQYQGLTKILQESQTDKIGTFLLKSRKAYY